MQVLVNTLTSNILFQNIRRIQKLGQMCLGRHRHLADTIVGKQTFKLTMKA